MTPLAKAERKLLEVLSSGMFNQPTIQSTKMIVDEFMQALLSDHNIMGNLCERLRVRSLRPKPDFMRKVLADTVSEACGHDPQPKKRMVAGDPIDLGAALSQIGADLAAALSSAPKRNAEVVGEISRQFGKAHFLSKIIASNAPWPAPQEVPLIMPIEEGARVTVEIPRGRGGSRFFYGVVYHSWLSRKHGRLYCVVLDNEAGLIRVPEKRVRPINKGLRGSSQ